ncbi:hypothetical protein KH5_00920 [Urechidicola sp. KH5]
MEHLSTEQITNGLEHIKQSPKESGKIELIICRPEENKREVLKEAQLDVELGVVGDNWKTRGSSRTTDGFGHPDMQINMMNARIISLIAQSKERWKLAGDQFYVDFDLSEDNIPPGTQLALGSAILERTEIPHLGCKKFVERFGLDAMKFVNSKEGKALNLRGVNLKVVKSGTVKTGDLITKL